MMIMMHMMFVTWVCTHSMMFSLSVLMLIHALLNFSSFTEKFTSFWTMGDELSMTLSIMSLWMSIMMCVGGGILGLSSSFGALVCTSAWLMVASFKVNNMMSFYLSFEASLIPITLIIIKWGYQPERLQAALYMFTYTISSSLPLLFMMIMYLKNHNSLMFYMTHWGSVSYLMVLSMVAFMVKTPLYTLHLWLPKAHVEAPISGSILLAAVLLKLGTYGMLRMGYILPMVLMSSKTLIMSISSWGALICSSVCLKQNDLKSLIAYTSVSHMGLAVIGIYSMTSWGWKGSLAMLLAHASISSAMFSVANMMYSMYMTRSTYLIGGVGKISNVLSLWFIMVLASNMGVPPSLNFFSEIMLYLSWLMSSQLNSMFILSLVGLTSGYTCMMYLKCMHGGLNTSIKLTNTSKSMSSSCFTFLWPTYLVSSSVTMMSNW